MEHVLYLNLPLLITDLLLFKAASDLTEVNILDGDGREELDTHSADGSGMTGCYLSSRSNIVKTSTR